MKKTRIDKLLVDHGIFESRNKAQNAIAEGLVSFKGEVVIKPNFEVNNSDSFKANIDVREGKSTRYVSRGGIKLEGALAKLDLSVKGLRALDIGISTGGFSDCLLQGGIREVVGIDVGHKQIHPSLLAAKNLFVFEGVNVRDLTREFFTELRVSDQFDLVVGDVSFISVRKVLPCVAPFVKPGGQVLFLIKPQFELEKKDLGKGGIVKNSSSYQAVEKMVTSLFEDLKFSVLNYFESSITGSDGNQEFFIYAKKA